MVNETWVTLAGNVATDVTKRRTTTGDVVNFRVMSTARKRDVESGDWQDGSLVAARVSCWRRLAENVQASVVKGDPVVVHGRLSVRQYEVDGQRREAVEIDATNVGLNLAMVQTRIEPREPRGAGAPVVDVTSLPEVPPVDGDPWFGPASHELAAAIPAAPLGAGGWSSSPLAGPEAEAEDEDPLERAAMAS